MKNTIKTYSRNEKLYFISSEDINKLELHVKGLGWTYKIVDGMYRGQREQSIVIVDRGHNEYMLESIKRLGVEHNQECVMSVNLESKATLHYMTGESVMIGVFRQAKEDEVTSHENWTFDRENNTYYITT